MIDIKTYGAGRKKPCADSIENVVQINRMYLRYISLPLSVTLTEALRRDDRGRMLSMPSRLQILGSIVSVFVQLFRSLRRQHAGAPAKFLHIRPRPPHLQQRGLCLSAPLHIGLQLVPHRHQLLCLSRAVGSSSGGGSSLGIMSSVRNFKR